MGRILVCTVGVSLPWGVRKKERWNRRDLFSLCSLIDWWSWPNFHQHQSKRNVQPFLSQSRQVRLGSDGGAAGKNWNVFFSALHIRKERLHKGHCGRRNEREKKHSKMLQNCKVINVKFVFFDASKDLSIPFVAFSFVIISPCSLCGILLFFSKFKKKNFPKNDHLGAFGYNRRRFKESGIEREKQKQT